MKKILVLFLLISSIASAQRDEKIRAYKTAFITDALALTSSEAEKFWPIYNFHEEKLKELRMKERKEIFEKMKGDFNALSDAEANVLLDKAMGLREKEFLYQKELVQNLKEILPAKKILKLKRAEEEFKRTLLNKIKERKGERP
ncbi:MAG: sensor of ECF-type sigma factor [Flavobacteriaceae bacterium]